MDEYVAKQIEKLVQIENDLDLLNHQLSNPDIPYRAPRNETVLVIFNRIKLMQDKIRELKEDIKHLTGKIKQE